MAGMIFQGAFCINKIGQAVMWLIDFLFEGVGNWGVAVILFTLILRAVMSPLDVWQKVVMTRNNRAMERMKPQLEKLQKQYGGNRELYSQKQMELYRKEKYSMLGGCLPMIVSMVIFFMVFAGFNGMIKQYNADMFEKMQTEYNVAFKAARDGGESTEDATAAAQDAVLRKYDAEYKKQIRFLWVKNVFMPDSWKRPVPDYETFIGSGIGKLSITEVDIEDGVTGYDKVMGVLTDKYNDVNRDGKKKAWNGLMLLPILAGLLTFASTKLMQVAQPPPPAPPRTGDGKGETAQNAVQTNMKMMQYFMPIMLGVLALLYSTAFTIYMLVSNIFSTVFQLIYNFAVKRNDKKREDERLSTTYK